MIRSLSFGSLFYDSISLLKLDLSSPFISNIKLTTKINSLAHYAKGTLLFVKTPTD